MDDLIEQKNLEQEQDFVIEDVSPQFENNSETKEGLSDTETIVEQSDLSDQKECVQESVPDIQQESKPDGFELTLEKYDAIVEAIRNLDSKFEEKIRVDSHKNELFDKMYNELQSYKTDLYAKILKPFVLSTITLLNDTEVFINSLGEDNAVLAEKFLRSLPEDIINILVSNGVELYTDESETFNPKTQKILQKTPTDQKEQDGLIAKRVRAGYAWNGVIVYPELVWIYKYSS